MKDQRRSRLTSGDPSAAAVDRPSPSPPRRALWRWAGGLVGLAVLAALVYGFWPVSIRLTYLGTVHSTRIRSSLQSDPNWMMATSPDSEAFDDYGVRPSTSVDLGSVDFSRFNVVISHGRPLQRLTYTRWSRLLARYQYWINRPLGRATYKGSFSPNELYLYVTPDKTFVWWGAP